MGKLEKILLIGILLLSLLSRAYKALDRAPFAWDQERDMYAVQKIITEKRPVLSGPVVKGEGGFLLGPLYYYLLVPGYLLAQGSPFGSVYTSIILDVLTVGLIYLLVRRTSSTPGALLAACLWAFSWFAIESSRISWNVILIPAFTSLALYASVCIRQGKTGWLYLLIFLMGLSIHVHPSVFLLAPLLVILSVVNNRKVTLQDFFRSVPFFLFPLLPLFLFDLRHEFTNLKLMMNFFNNPALSSISLGESIKVTATKLFLTISALTIGQQKLYLGAVLFTLSFLYLGLTARKSFFHKALLASIVLNVVSVVKLQDRGFAEYYFTPLFVPYFVALSGIVVSLLTSWKSRYSKLVLLVPLLIYASINIRALQTSPTPYSLKHKLNLVETISSLAAPLAIDNQLPLSQKAGMQYLLEYHHITSDPSSPHHAVILESGSPYTSLGNSKNTKEYYFGGLKLVEVE